MPTSPFTIAVSATFTAEPIQRVIEFWGRQLETPFDVRFASYNQVPQTLLDPASVFGANQRGLNVALFRLEDLAAGRLDDLRQIEANARELVRTMGQSARTLASPLLVCSCLPSHAFVNEPERARLSRDLSSQIRSDFEGIPGVQFLSWEDVDRLYPVESPLDPDTERLAHIPYSELYFVALGTAIVRRAHALFTAPYKVIALDCDNTLWQGICGEDGPSGVVLDAGRRALQEFMLEQRNSGMLLALASKNNEQDVWDTFAANPHMPLRPEHLAAWRLNWEPKEENLRSLAEELNLGAEALIFIDDNPKECAEVQGAIPEALTLPLPADADRFAGFLRHVWAFDHPVVTEEDRNRNRYYAQAREFGEGVRKAASLQEFMATLGLDVRIQPLAPERVARAAQLTQRTNQFNFTTVRRTEAEIRALPPSECFAVEVTDRFGNYGMTGLIIFSENGQALEIDTFLLSCRVLGRGVEHRMMAWLGEQAVQRGLGSVIARFAPSKKNKPAQQFLESIGSETNGVFRFDAAELRGLKWSPAAPVAGPESRLLPKGGGRPSIDYAEIACELASPRQILEAMRRGSGAVQHDAAMTDVERQLATIWSDLLKRPSVDIADNFFDLGGHSLLAVLLIVRVRETFGVELPIDDVYSASLTLGELARRIEVQAAGGTGPDEYRAILAEIESLSDEEVQALLAKEDPAACDFF